MSDRLRSCGATQHKVLVVCVVCCAFAAAPGRAEEATVSHPLPLAETLLPELDELLAISLRQSPRMLATRLERLRREQLIYVSSSRLYPSANASWDVRLQREDRLNTNSGETESRDTEKSYYSLGVSQPLFYWGSLRASAEIGKIAAQIAENNLIDAYRSLALEVRRAYLNLILDYAALRQSEADLQLQRDRVDTIRISVEAGVARSGAVNSALNAIERAELALDRQRRNFEFSVEQFRRLTGADDFEVADIPEQIPKFEEVPENVTLNIHQEFVENDRYRTFADYGSAELRLEQEKLDQHIAQVSTRPNVSAIAGITQDERSDTVDVGNRYEFEATYIGLRITWNVFDGFAGRGRRLAAATAVRQRENSLDDTTENLLQSAERAWTEVDFARRSLDFAERSLRSAENRLGLRREDFDLGQVSRDEVVDAENALASIERTTFAARVDYLNALAAFLSAVNADPVVDAATPELLMEP